MKVIYLKSTNSQGHSARMIKMHAKYISSIQKLYNFIKKKELLDKSAKYDQVAKNVIYK